MTAKWLLASGLLALIGCRDDRLWPASMDQQPAIQALAEARPVPAGAVPIGGVEVVFDRDDLEDLAPPRPFDQASADRGKALFAIHCVACHGPEAKGDGPVSAKFPPAPNLRHFSICKRTDGFLYGTLTAGGRAMPTMREGTTSQDRWDLVAFVRALQREGCTGETPAPTGSAPTAAPSDSPSAAPSGSAPTASPSGSAPAAARAGSKSGTP